MSTFERRQRPPGRFHPLQDALSGVLRAIAHHAHDFYTALGTFLVVGAVVAILGTWVFLELAEHVRAGGTQRFDDAVLVWMGAHRAPWLEHSLLEITALGTGLVVLMVAAVAALFLALTEHRYSAFLLLFATAGGIALNGVLKHYFHRPRPRIIVWETHASTSSFPSGHAMNAIIVYATIAYLAARLEKRPWQRWLTLIVASAAIVLTALSRVYLGVHYPSDIVAGLIIGLAWVGFCLAGLEAVRVFALHFHPSELSHERHLEPHERSEAGLDS
jgi:undecaprenyl-diphosphatase